MHQTTPGDTRPDPAPPRPARLRRVGRTAVAVALIAALAGCSGSDSSSSTTSPPTTAAATTTTAPAVDLDDPVFDTVRSRAGELVEEHGLTGAGLIVVDREDGIVFEDYWGEFDADRVSLVASSSKMLTAGVLLRLADQGKLDLDQPIVEYVDWATDNPDVTVSQLLSNSSGLVGLSDTMFAPYLCQFVGGDLRDCGEAIFNTPDDDDRVVPPDTEFRYGGGQWQVAGAVAETVSGKSWAELVEETYVEPCGVESLGYGNHWAKAVTSGSFYPKDFDPATADPTDNPHMEGGVYVDAPDYAQLLLMHLREGECPNGRVLSAEAVEQAHTDRTLPEIGSETGVPYGLGWWVDRDSGRISDGGAYGSTPWLDLEDGYGAYLVIEADSGTGSAIAEELYDPIETAVLARR